jgi:hypothetical protein
MQRFLFGDCSTAIVLQNFIAKVRNNLRLGGRQKEAPAETGSNITPDEQQ